LAYQPYAGQYGDAAIKFVTTRKNQFFTGDLLHGALDPTLGSPLAARATGCHGF
jgi:hypothetical protein